MNRELGRCRRSCEESPARSSRSGALVACSVACCAAAFARAPGLSPCSASSLPDSARGDWPAHPARLVPLEPSPQSDDLEAGALLVKEEPPGIHVAAATPRGSLTEQPAIPAHESVGLQSYWVQAAEPDQPDPGALKAPVSPGMGEPSGAHVAAAVP
jgi:hypothetical protein